MSEMFKCKDGTMFPINDILSIEEVKYHDKEGVETIVFESVSEVAKYVKSRSYAYDETFIGRFFRHLFVKCSRVDVRESDKNEKLRSEASIDSTIDMIKEGLRCNDGPITGMLQGELLVLKQWDVRIRHKKYAVRISHDDYKRLCGKMK